MRVKASRSFTSNSTVKIFKLRHFLYFSKKFKKKRDVNNYGMLNGEQANGQEEKPCTQQIEQFLACLF